MKYFTTGYNTCANIVSELVGMSDAEFTQVFDSKFKHLDILIQSALTIVLYIRADRTFTTELARLPASFEVFENDIVAAADKLPVRSSREPKFSLCSPSQKRTLFHVARMMCITNTFVTQGSRKGRLMEISSRLVEGVAYATGGGYSLHAIRRELLFEVITAIMPKSRPFAVRTEPRSKMVADPATPNSVPGPTTESSCAAENHLVEPYPSPYAKLCSETEVAHLSTANDDRTTLLSQPEGAESLSITRNAGPHSDLVGKLPRQKIDESTGEVLRDDRSSFEAEILDIERDSYAVLECSVDAPDIEKCCASYINAGFINFDDTNRHKMHSEATCQVSDIVVSPQFVWKQCFTGSHSEEYLNDASPADATEAEDLPMLPVFKRIRTGSVSFEDCCFDVSDLSSKACKEGSAAVPLDRSESSHANEVLSGDHSTGPVSTYLLIRENNIVS
jgi:hypothetical protein